MYLLVRKDTASDMTPEVLLHSEGFWFIVTFIRCLIVQMDACAVSFHIHLQNRGSHSVTQRSSGDSGLTGSSEHQGSVGVYTASAWAEGGIQALGDRDPAGYADITLKQ